MTTRRTVRRQETGAGWRGAVGPATSSDRYADALAGALPHTLVYANSRSARIRAAMLKAPILFFVFMKSAGSNDIRRHCAHLLAGVVSRGSLRLADQATPLSGSLTERSRDLNRERCAETARNVFVWLDISRPLDDIVIVFEDHDPSRA